MVMGWLKVISDVGLGTFILVGGLILDGSISQDLTHYHVRMRSELSVFTHAILSLCERHAFFTGVGNYGLVVIKVIWGTKGVTRKSSGRVLAIIYVISGVSYVTSLADHNFSQFLSRGRASANGGPTVSIYSRGHLLQTAGL